MRREHLLTAVLADDTRFAIYRSIAEKPHQSVTVIEVAERFGLHPNVARMHLGKLEQAGLLTTSLRKCPGGGRPAKLYELPDRVSTFAFPPRHYELLASLALEALAVEGADEVVTRVCHDAGVRIAQAYREERHISGPLRGHPLAAAVQDIGEEQGMMPEVEWGRGGLRIEVCNCVFHEAAAGRPELSCVIHRAFIKGLLDGLVGDARQMELMAEGPSMNSGGERCHLRYAAPA